ncbi:hypothetical protein Csa_006991 [Cucumis sativus]|nr:hypothetical protein Csa_006991 [Cucumis sativus]
MGSLFFFLMDFDIMVFKGFFIFENQVILAASITHSPTIFILQCPPVSSFQIFFLQEVGCGFCLFGKGC